MFKKILKILIILDVIIIVSCISEITTKKNKTNNNILDNTSLLINKVNIVYTNEEKIQDIKDNKTNNILIIENTNSHTKENNIKNENKTKENRTEKLDLLEEKETENIIQDYNYNQDETKEMFTYLNNFRKENGLETLTWNNNLESMAKIRAKEIESNFSHTRPDGNTVLEVDYVYGENLGYSNFKTVNLMFDKFQNSSEHRKNLLDTDFKSVGIACYYSEIKKEYYWVQLFGM